MKKSNKIGRDIDPCQKFQINSRYELKVAPIFTR